MSRLKDTLLKGVSYGKAASSKMVDLSQGGQYGYQFDPGAYMSNTGYTPRNIIPILVEYPRGFNHMQNPDKSIAVLRSLMEEQSKQITGLRTGVNVEVGERQISGAGHMQKDPTNVTEELSVPTHVWDERYGRAVNNFWQWYIRNLIGEPITKQPGVMNITNSPPEDHLADFYSMTMLYIEPDPLRRSVNEAWLITNMFPPTSGILESQMDIAAAASIPEISIEFTGIPVVSMGVRKLAQEVLDRLVFVNAGPMQRPAFVDKIVADIKASKKGYVEDVIAASKSSAVK